MYKFIIKIFIINCAFISLASAVDGKTSMKTGSKLSTNECKFHHIDSRTGEIIKTVVHSCDFSQTKEDMMKSQIAIKIDNTPLAQGKCVFSNIDTRTGVISERTIQNCTQINNECEEIADTYVICHGSRYELTKSVSSTLTRDAKKIQDVINLDASKASGGAIPK